MRRVIPIQPGEPIAGPVPGVVVVGVFTGEHGAVAGRGGELLSAALGIDAVAPLAAGSDFTGAEGQLARVVVVADGDVRATLIGVGLGSEAALTPDVLRAAAMRSAASARGAALTSTLALEGADALASIRAVVEGVGLGDYRYSHAASQAVPETAELRLLVAETVVPDAVSATIRLGAVAAESANWVRQLVEMPGSSLGPAEFAAAIVARANELAPDAIEVSVWSTAEMAERGFGATLAVGAGSARRPCVVEMRSRADGTPIALAGKGITFDAGGINIKQDGSELAWMKSDMAAAAAVAAAVIAAASLGVPTPVHVILPIAENMPGGNAVRPGDVVIHPGGRSTEVTDTDCEGRLVLADAIAWLAATRPRAIVDVGTLTNSGDVGTALWGCWTNTPALGRELVEAGLSSGDPGWVLPLVASYRSLLESPVADSANAAGDAPDSGQLAATYLEPFAAGVPWLHLDNGSGAYLERDAAEWPKGATGTPTRALIDYLRGAVVSDHR